MAERFDKTKSAAMISALNTFAANVDNEMSAMQTLCNTCVQAIGEDDMAASKILAEIQKCQLKYKDATKRARSIAAAIQNESDDLDQENNIWSED